MTEPTTADILTRARALIADREAWTSRAFARKANGATVASTDPQACKWCMMGAVEKVCGDLETYEGPALDMLRKAVAILSHHDLVSAFNDNKTHADALAAMDLAANLASTHTWAD